MAMVRCEEMELLETVGVPDHLVAQAYRELWALHFWLGNSGAILRLLQASSPLPRRVLDIGCGHGALLQAVRTKVGSDVIGVDLRPPPINSPVTILTRNAVTDPLPEADLAVCLMMAHHLSASDLTAMIQNVGRSCNRLILLDLVRHPTPLWLFRFFVAPFLSKINAEDGKTSVRRAYTANEMAAIVKVAAATSPRPILKVDHSVSLLWIRQVVDIVWE